MTTKNERPAVEANRCRICKTVVQTDDPAREDAWFREHDCNGEPTIDEPDRVEGYRNWSGTDTNELLPVPASEVWTPGR